MIRRKGVVLTILGILLLSLACGAPRPTTEPIATLETEVATQEPTLEETEVVVTPEFGEGFKITLDNQTPYEICYVYISFIDDDYWGDDRLTVADVIAPGQSWDFDMEAGVFDLMARDCDGVSVGSAWSLEEAATVTFGAPGTISIKVENDSEYEICYVHISPSANEDWGVDQLGTGATIQPEEAYYFFVEPDTYDLQAQNCDDQVLLTATEVEISGEFTWTVSEVDLSEPSVGDGEPFTVRVENKTTEDICYIYIANSDEDSWGDDWLGDDELLAPGGDLSFEVPGGTYDIQALDCDEYVLASAWEISADEYLTPGAGGSLVLSVNNESSQDICYLYVSPSANEEWDADLLGDSEIVPAQGGRRKVYVESGTYDLLAEDCDGETLEEQLEVDISEDITWTLSDS